MQSLIGTVVGGVCCLEANKALESNENDIKESEPIQPTIMDNFDTTEPLPSTTEPLTLPTLKHKSSWFTKSNSHSPSPQHHTIRSRDSTHSIHSPTNTSYGYIQSLPTSSSNHGWIYHPQYGMILFTYNQALETARSHKQITRNYSGYMSESESYNDTNHLYLPSDLATKSSHHHHSRSPSPYGKYSGYTCRSWSPSPSPSPIPMSTNNNSSNTDYGLSDINRLYVYQPVKFELGKQHDNKSDQQMHSPICNLSEYEDNNSNGHNPTSNPMKIPTLNPSEYSSSNPTQTPTHIPSENPTSKPSIIQIVYLHMICILMDIHINYLEYF